METQIAKEITVTNQIKPRSDTYFKGLFSFFEEIGKLTMYNVQFFREVFVPKYEFKELIRQCYLIGFKTFPLIAITAFIMGLVMTVQSRPTLEAFGAESWLPAMVAVSIIREIGPVITALIFAGKVGSGIGAELASMKVTEQIDAMEVSGINPFKYIVVTRVVAATFMLPVLVIIGDGISLYGSYVGVNLKGEVSIQLFFLSVFGKLSFPDLIPAIVKTFFFGYFIALISCYKGTTAQKGTEGVGNAANAAVVLGSLSVFILDMLAVQITDFLF